MKKCVECELNYVKAGDDVCSVCKNKKIGNITNRVSNKLSNEQIRGNFFKDNIAGFGDYLIARGYGIASEKGNLTTVVEYANAVVKICQIENLTYEILKKQIDKFIKMYDVDGLKKELGNYQNGTYRNALKRFKEFTEYLRLYNNNTGN